MAFFFDYLFDTNIFLRLAEKNSSERPFILDAIRKIRANNQTICFTPQILAEFWNVYTRPATSRGGFGLSIEQTERKANLIQKYFEILPILFKFSPNGEKSFPTIKCRAYRFTTRNSSLR